MAVTGARRYRKRMDISIALAAALALATAEPSTRSTDPVMGPVQPAPRVAAFVAPVPARDTIIEYDRAYYTRLTIHRWASYTMLPLFATQYYLGSKLINGDEDANKDLHQAVAATIAGLFVVNTTTGLMNLWAMRADPNDRARRITHVTLMLLADAGFVTTGLLADGAEEGGSGANTHRAVALSSMAVATVGWLIQTDLFKKD